MGMPNLYQTASAPFLGSYTSVDISTGRAYANFYGMDFMATTSGQYILTQNTNSAMFGNTGSGNNGALDLDFDLTITQPLIVDGKCIINVPLVCSAISTNHAVNPIVTNWVRLVSGATEIELVSGQLTYSTGTITAGQVFERMTAMVLAIPRTNFKAGDKLRLTVTTNAPGANSAVNIGHDPAQRGNLYELNNNIGTSVPTWGNSRLTFTVPIVIDI